MKTVIITGGSKGLGLAIVDSLLGEGHRVFTCSRTITPEIESRLKNLKFRDRLSWQAFDVGTDDADDLISRAAEWAGADDLYGLVNNAGIAAEGVLATFPVVDIERVLRVNLSGSLQMARAMLRILLAQNQGGRIINISSIIGTRGYTGLAAYSASKAGMDGMTRSLAREVGRRNITVNSIAPGYIGTDMSASLSATKIEQIAKRTPMRRLAEFDDVTPLLLFLLSDGARFVTGQTILVDGGISC